MFVMRWVDWWEFLVQGWVDGSMFFIVHRMVGDGS